MIDDLVPEQLADNEIQGAVVTVVDADDPEQSSQTWTQIGSNRFTLDDGDQALAFTTEGNMVTSQTASNSFEPLPWYETPLRHLLVDPSALGSAGGGERPRAPAIRC